MKPLFNLFLIVLIFFSCQKNDEESAFLTFKNKRAQMEGDWVIDKVYGNGIDLTDSFLIDMPNFTYNLTDMQYRESYYYYLFIQSKRILYFGPLIYGTNYIEIPILIKSQTDSLFNDLPITYKELSNYYTVKSVNKNKISIALYTNKYQEIILRKL